MFAAAAALLVAAAQVPAAPPAPSDDARAAAGAAFAFAQACFLRMAVDQTPAAYAAGSDEVGRGIGKVAPPFEGRVTIDGAGGRGCSVAYHGAEAALAWRAFGQFYTGLATTGQAGACKPSASTTDRLAAVCRSAASQPGEPKTVARSADLLIVRGGAGAQASVTATLTDLRP